ncbi:40S ribosomal protein S1 [Orobanche gracilis]
MSVYMSRLFPRSNSSFFLRSGNALEAKSVRLSEEMYLIDAGVGRPRIATQNEINKPPETSGPTSRCFVDLVTGDSRTKQQAAARFNDILGQNDAVGSGDQPLLLPRRFRKHRAFLELKNMWRANAKVKGFVTEKVKRRLFDRDCRLYRFYSL